MSKLYSVPRIYHGDTFFLLAGGPSLAGFNPDILRNHGRIIVINNAYQLCPWADILYFGDALWWNEHRTRVLSTFTGTYKISMNCSSDGVLRVAHGGLRGLSLDPTALAHGGNSGYQAVNLAFLMGAKQIVLLGYDMQGAHWHPPHAIRGQHARTEPYRQHQMQHDWVPRFSSLIEPLATHGVSVLNCNPDSAIRCFPFADLNTILEEK